MVTTMRFVRTLLAGAALSVAATLATFSMEAWAPAAFRALESVGNFQYKPWIFFTPALFCVVLAAVAVRPYRNPASFTALFLGALVAAVVGGAAIVVLAAASLPGMRY
jgi:hypothetical protein